MEELGPPIRPRCTHSPGRLLHVLLVRMVLARRHGMAAVLAELIIRLHGRLAGGALERLRISLHQQPAVDPQLHRRCRGELRSDGQRRAAAVLEDEGRVALLAQAEFRRHPHSIHGQGIPAESAYCHGDHRGIVHVPSFLHAGYPWRPSSRLDSRSLPLLPRRKSHAAQAAAGSSMPGRNRRNPVQCAQLNLGRCSVSATLSSRSVFDATLSFFILAADRCGS
jgi:hypothetical protein